MYFYTFYKIKTFKVIDAFFLCSCQKNTSSSMYIVSSQLWKLLTVQTWASACCFLMFDCEKGYSQGHSSQQCHSCDHVGITSPVSVHLSVTVYVCAYLDICTVVMKQYWSLELTQSQMLKQVKYISLGTLLFTNNTCSKTGVQLHQVSIKSWCHYPIYLN